MARIERGWVFAGGALEAGAAGLSPRVNRRLCWRGNTYRLRWHRRFGSPPVENRSSRSPNFRSIACGYQDTASEGDSDNRGDLARGDSSRIRVCLSRVYHALRTEAFFELVAARRIRMRDSKPRSKLTATKRGRLASGINTKIRHFERCLRLLDRVDAAIFAAGLETFEDETALALWLCEPAVALNGKVPLDALRSAQGRKQVARVLAAISYGVCL